MATHEQKAECERQTRAFLREHDLPEPDSVEYGCTCIWIVFEASKTRLRVDIDEDPEWDYEQRAPKDGAAW